MERKLLCQPFTATNCSTLARHALKLICQTTFDSILFKLLLSHAGQLSCCDITEVTCPKMGFSAADDADARSVVFVFIQINTFTYLRKMSIYQTNSVYVKLYLYSTKWYLRLKISVQGPFKSRQFFLPMTQRLQHTSQIHMTSKNVDGTVLNKQPALTHRELNVVVL